MRWKQRDITFLGAGCSYLRCYLSREADFGRDLGMLGIVGLGWIIIDLSRCKLKEEKKLPGGVDVIIKVFISS